MRSISFHINRLLYIIGAIFLLFIARVYYLAIIKHDYHKDVGRRPQIRTTIETPNRGTIRDRFNYPLAVNSISYCISIIYDPIAKLNRRKLHIVDGKKTYTYPRKEAIENLAAFVSNYCDKDEQEIRDLIYSKASLFPKTPFVLASHIDEELFYKLKFKEKDFKGLCVEMKSKRSYPRGKTACHILGYLGAINEREHSHINAQIQTLKQYLQERKSGTISFLPKGYNSVKQCQKHLDSLLDRSYSITSEIGKSGIEKQFDSDLKGAIGKTLSLVDHKGNRRAVLPESYKPQPGRRVLLTISADLQEHCEQLLTKSELARSKRFAQAGKKHNTVKPPWILGGSIVAMIPKTGEIVALASYPRFDPNDFSSKDKSNALKWLETSKIAADIFDGKMEVEKEIMQEKANKWEVTSTKLTYELFLDTILSKKSSIKTALNKIHDIHHGNFLQNCIEMLLALSNQDSIHALIDSLYPEKRSNGLTFYNTKEQEQKNIIENIMNKTSLLGELRAEIDPYFESIYKNDDKILLLDLLKLFCPNHLFDDTLLAQTGTESLATYKDFCNSKAKIEKEVETIAKEVFHREEFSIWREKYFKGYLKEKRKSEKLRKTHARPYITYLNRIENELFKQFFAINKWQFISAYLTIGAPIDKSDIKLPYFQALIQKGLGNDDPVYKSLRTHLSKLSDDQIIPYLKTMRNYEDLVRPLYGKYYFAFKTGKVALEKDLARAFYPGAGFGYSKSHGFAEITPLGSSFKMFTGYQGLLDYFNNNENLLFPINPLTIIDQSPSYNTKITRNTVLGYKEDYTPIKRIYKGGRLPRGHLNIGKVDFIKAMERSSNLYFSVLASDVINDPASLIATSKNLGFGTKTGIELPYEAKGSVPSDVLTNKTSLFSLAFGQHSLIVTPLQTAVALSCFANKGSVLEPKIVSAIANVEAPEDKLSLLFNKDIKYKDLYAGVGLYFPLFPQAQTDHQTRYLKKRSTKTKKKMDLPNPVHKTLMESLYSVVNSDRGTARTSAIRGLYGRPIKRSMYNRIRPHMAGKTSTAEIAYKPNLDRENPAIITKNIWFTAVHFEQEKDYDTADLVVIVYLRFGDHGKEAAPLAASVMNHWKKIQKTEQEKLEASFLQ